MLQLTNSTVRTINKIETFNIQIETFDIQTETFGIQMETFD
jgi:hypothetical protein